MKNYTKLIGRVLGWAKKTFAQRVRSIGRRCLGREVQPHLYRHLLACDIARDLKLDPATLQGMLGHPLPQEASRREPTADSSTYLYKVPLGIPASWAWQRRKPAPHAAKRRLGKSRDFLRKGPMTQIV